MSIEMSTKNIWLGIASSILAGAFWGLVFLTPALTRGFTPIQLSAGRYLAYGVVAVVLLAPSWRRLARTLTRRDWVTLFWLSLAGNTFYYVCLANGVQSGGVAMTSLVIGLLPITVTLAGSRDRDAVPLRRLLPSLLLSAAGLACISWQSLAAPLQTAKAEAAFRHAIAHHEMERMSLRQPVRAGRAADAGDQAWPASLESIPSGTPIFLSAISYLPPVSGPKIRSRSGAQWSQPLCWISFSSWPGAQPA